MKSIYSKEILQRILDHWGIGQIEDLTYFDGGGHNIWQHFIDTNQGEFELYSYVTSEKDFAEPQLKKHLEKRFGNHLTQLQKKQLVHSFGRYHVLLQITKKHQINVNQASKDLDLLIGSTIKKAFRVYGTIIQMHLDEANVNKAGVLVSYGSWLINRYERGLENIVVDSRIQSNEELDTAIELIEKDTPSIIKYVLKDTLFALHLSNGTILQFMCSENFPAIEVHLKSKRNDLLVFEERKIFYTKDFREN